MLTSLKPYLSIARVDKPVGTTLLFLPCLWGTLLAAQKPKDYLWLLVFYVGAFLMRSAGCVINDFFDKDFDALVKRTKNRPLANGTLSSKKAIMFFCLLCALAFLIFLQLPIFSKALALYGFSLMLIYPLLKRVTYFPQLGLGLAFNCGVMVSFAAVETQMSFLELTLKTAPFYIGGVIWTLSYDTLYAFQDFEDDKKIGVKSLTHYFSQYNEKNVLDWLFFASFFCYLVGGKLFSLSAFYDLSLCLLLGCHFYLSHTLDMKNPHTYKHYFMNQQWMGILLSFAIFLGKLT